MLQPGGKLGLTVWTSSGWLASFKAALPEVTLPSIYNAGGPWSSEESVTTLLTAAGFTDVEVNALTFDKVDSIPHIVKTNRKTLSASLKGDDGDKYEAYMLKTYGDGEVSFPWQAFVITAAKP